MKNKKRVKNKAYKNMKRASRNRQKKERQNPTYKPIEIRINYGTKRRKTR